MWEFSFFSIPKNPRRKVWILALGLGFFSFCLCVAGACVSWAESENTTKVLKSGSLQRERGKFGPSLSETLSDVHRQKSKAERQLAQQLRKPSPQGRGKKTPSDEKARFGDLELSLSERGEESLRESDSSSGKPSDPSRPSARESQSRRGRGSTKKPARSSTKRDRLHRLQGTDVSRPDPSQ